MIDDLLRDALSDALSEDRWDVPVRPGLLSEVRQAHRTRRRVTAAASAVGGAALVAGIALGVTALPDHHDQLGTFAAGGVPAGSPAPGISPEWVPQTGRDWLLSTSDDTAFWAAHTRPSPAPGQSVVASPAPLGPQSAALLADVEAAGLPQGAQLRREDDMGGQPDAPGVHITLADGTPVEVYRLWAQGPMPFVWQDGYDHSDAKVEDVPGTLSAGVAYSHFGYGFPGQYRADGAHGVFTVTRGGEWTTWAAPAAVPLDTLKQWAFAAAQHEGD